MASVPRSYRLRIRDASTVAHPDGTTDDLVITSIPGGTNPYIAGPPTGDGQELDPLSGQVRTGAYTIQVIDAITSGTTRVVTSKLFDSSGRQQMLSRRAYFEMSVDGGATWPTVLIAGYVAQYRLTDAITYEFQIADSRRVEEARVVFTGLDTKPDGTPSTNFLQRGCLIGGPILSSTAGRAFWGPVPDRGGWTFKVVGTSAIAGSADHFVQLAFVSGFRGIGDPITRKLNSAIGAATGGILGQDVVNKAASPFYAASVTPYGLAGFPGLVAFIPTLAGAANAGRFTPAAMHFAIGSAGPLLVSAGSTVNMELFWPSSVSLPSAGDLLQLYVFSASASDASPVYVTEHPVDLITKLWDDAGVPYDSATATTVRNLLGPDLRVSMRIAAPQRLLDFIEANLFAVFGISARTNASGARELFTMRVKNTADPVTTIDTVALRSASDVIFNVEELTVVSTVSLKVTWYYPYTPSIGIGDVNNPPVDSVVAVDYSTSIDNGDVSAFGSKTVALAIAGMIHDVNGFSPSQSLGVLPSPLLAGIAEEIFDRYGHGAPTGEMRCLPDQPLWGDVNGDGFVDALDAQEIIRYTLSLPVTNLALLLARGDVNNDGVINVLDAAAIATYAANGTVVGRTGQPIAGFSPLRIGDEVYLQPAHLPVNNKRFGDDNTVGPRIVQIVRRTEEPEGPYFKYIDAGSDQQPASPAATISIAANAANGRSIAEFTITNAAAINATGVLGVAVQFAIGASSPTTDGMLFTRYRAGLVPTTAQQLSIVKPGLTVWVRARTEQSGRRPSAWTAWVSVTLSSMTAPTGLSFTNLRRNAVQFNWTNTNALDFVDVFVFEGGSAPADWTPYFVASVQPGSTSLVVRGLKGPSVTYVGAVMHRDPATGERSVAATGTFTTNNTLDTAPDMDGILALPTINDASLPIGIPLGLYPADQNFDIEIERAPDVSGSPGTFAQIAVVSGTTQVFIDSLPSDGVTRWYRARSSLSGYTPSAYTASVSAIPGGISEELQKGIAPDVPLCLAIVPSIRPDGSGIVSVQCNDKTLSFKIAISGSGYVSDATLRAVTPTAGAHADTTFNSLAFPIGLYISVFPYAGAAGAGTEGPRHNLLYLTAPASVPQGTVLVDASGNWEASINVPLSVSQPSSCRYAWSTSGFPTHTDVITSGTNATPSADGVLSLSGTGLTLGQKVYISVICYAGTDLAVELPIIHVLGSYQSFGANKTFTWTPGQFNYIGDYGVSIGGAATLPAPRLSAVPAGDAALFLNLTPTPANHQYSVSFIINTLLPANGAILTELLAQLYLNSGVDTVAAEIVRGDPATGLTNLASVTASNTGTLASYTASLSETINENRGYAIVASYVIDFTGGGDLTKQAVGVVALTFTMPTPKAAL